MISPAAKVWIWNLLSVASPTILAIMSAPPNSVSSDFGQLVGMRHLISGMLCAIAGAATLVVPAAARPATLMKSLRFMVSSPCWMMRVVVRPSCEA
jgi:hypothetical protein